MKSKITFQKSSAKVFILLFVISFSFLSSLIAFGKAQSKPDDSHIALNSYHSRLNSVKQNAASLRKKVSSARQKEKLALAQLQKTQRELYLVQSKYLKTQKNLHGLQSDIEEAGQQIKDIDQQIYNQSLSLRMHLRHIYMYRADMLVALVESLLQSKSIIQFFNVLYYQRKLIASELKVIQAIRNKQLELRELQTEWRAKQEDLKLTMAESKELKGSISKKKNKQYGLVSRLRKERLSYESAERQLERESNQLTKKILTLSNGNGLNVSDLVKSYFRFPVRAAITSPFGNRMHPIFHVRSFHSGVDLGARRGTPIKASNGGIVIYAGWYSGYGKTVIISHSNGKSTLYAHQDRIAVKVGEKVYQDKVIGYVGSTGYSTGPHLHFEYRVGGKPRNPLTVVR